MRLLHSVAAHEKFIASGTYRTFCEDQVLNVTEKWSIHQLAGGALFYRVDEDGRDEDGLSILSECLVSPDGRLERFNVQSFSSKDDTIRLYKADYTFQDTYVQISRRIQGQEVRYDEFALMPDSIPYIRQTIYMGLMLVHLIKNGSTSYVFAPPLLSLQDDQNQKIIVDVLGEEDVIVGKRIIPTLKVQIADDVYYWLDEYHIPIQRTFRHNKQVFTVRISNYAHQ